MMEIMDRLVCTILGRLGMCEWIERQYLEKNNVMMEEPKDSPIWHNTHGTSLLCANYLANQKIQQLHKIKAISYNKIDYNNWEATLKTGITFVKRMKLQNTIGK